MTATPVNGLSSWNLGCAALLIVVVLSVFHFHSQTIKLVPTTPLEHRAVYWRTPGVVILATKSCLHFTHSLTHSPNLNRAPFG